MEGHHRRARTALRSHVQYFGAGAQPPGREQVQRPRMAPEVARATFLEYTLPNPRSMPHSLAVDAAGRVWIAGWDNPTNAVLRFDTATEQFKTYPVPTPNAVPHTPCVTRDGRVWMALNARGTAKVALIDPKTDQLVELKWDGRPSGTHSCQEDRDGNVWFSSLGGRRRGILRLQPEDGAVPQLQVPAARRLSTGLEGAARHRRGRSAAERCAPGCTT